MSKKVYIKKLNNIPAKIVVTPKDRDTKVIYYFYHFKESINRKIDIYLRSKDTHVELKGAILAKNKENINLSVNIHHIVGNNNCRVHIKTFLCDQSKFNFEGSIFIEKNAHLADSYLQQDNLVQSRGVVCNTSPQLEIRANDVKASHGATVKTFDEQDLYYLMSRGIALSESKQFIAQGFLSEVYGKNTDKVLKYFDIESFI